MRKVSQFVLGALVLAMIVVVFYKIGERLVSHKPPPDVTDWDSARLVEFLRDDSFDCIARGLKSEDQDIGVMILVNNGNVAGESGWHNVVLVKTKPFKYVIEEGAPVWTKGPFTFYGDPLVVNQIKARLEPKSFFGY